MVVNPINLDSKNDNDDENQDYNENQDNDENCHKG